MADDAGIVVTAGESQVLAVTNDGAVVWNTAIEGVLVNQPRLDGDLVFVAGKRAVVALRRATGEVAWAVATAAEGEPNDRANRPVVVDDTVVVSTAHGQLFGLDRASGATRWSSQLPTGSYAEPAAVDGLVVVVGVGEWFGIDAATGSTLWSGELGLFGTSSPVAYMDFGVPLAAVASDERLLAVDAHTGNLVWQTKAQQSESFQVPVLDRWHNLLVPDHWGRLTAFAAHDGVQQWTSDGDDGVAEWGEPVSLAPRVAVVALDAGGPRIVSPNGTATLDLPAEGHAAAAFDDGDLVVATYGGATNYLVAYRLHVGS